MSSSPNLSLSDLQRGILTEIGISQWKLEESDRIAHEHALQAKRTAGEISQPSSEQLSDSEAQSIPAVVEQKPVAVSPDENSEPGTEAISMPDRILFAWSESLFPAWFTQDLLLALGENVNAVEYIDPQRTQHYRDHALLCLSGDKLAYDGKQLTLPAGAEQLSSVFKKELWNVLAQHHDN